MSRSELLCVAVCDSVISTRGKLLQCVAVRCNVLHCIAVRCSALQCVVVCCSVLQCVAVCCSVLQCVTVCGSVTSTRGEALGASVPPLRRTKRCSSLSFSAHSAWDFCRGYDAAHEGTADAKAVALPPPINIFSVLRLNSISTAVKKSNVLSGAWRGFSASHVLFGRYAL